MKKSYRKLITDILIFGAGNASAKLIQFLLMPLYTSYLSTNEYGDAELINNISELLLPIITLCIYEASLRFVIERKKDSSRIVSTSITILFYMSALFLLFAVILNYFFKFKYSFYLYLVTVSYALKTILAYYIRGKDKKIIFSLSGCINAVALAVYSYIFLVVTGCKAEGYLLAIFFAYVTTGVYIVIFGKVYRELKISLHITSDVREMLSYSMPLIVYNIFYWFTTISGRYILAVFKGSGTAGLYIAALKIAAVINLFQQAVYAAFQLNASQQFYARDREQYYSRVINTFCVMYLMLGIVVVSLTSFLAKFTLKNEFNDGKIYLPVIMLATVINCISSLFGTMYTAYKMTNKTMAVSVIGAVINIIASVMLVPYLGIWGVCISGILCYLGQVIYKFLDIKSFCTININVRRIMLIFALYIIQVVGVTIILLKS